MLAEAARLLLGFPSELQGYRPQIRPTMASFVTPAGGLEVRLPGQAEAPGPIYLRVPPEVAHDEIGRKLVSKFVAM